MCQRFRGGLVEFLHSQSRKLIHIIGPQVCRVGPSTDTVLAVFFAVSPWPLLQQPTLRKIIIWMEAMNKAKARAMVH